MGIFNRLFGSGGKRNDLEESALALPWEQKPSIYEFVQSHFQAGKLIEDGKKLPDEDRINAGSQVRWAAGAMDGVGTHHMGGSGGEGGIALLSVVLDYCTAPSVENKLKVYEKVIRTHAVSVIDPFIEGLRQASAINFNRLYELAKSFVTEATDREPVKLGIALLGLFEQESDKEFFRTLGQHDEFTLFCAVALANAKGDPEQELWELGRNVHGWGRIHVVERLAKTNDPAIKDWLLRDGYKNSVMYEYLAYTCATGGDLLSALSSDSVDADLLASVGDIIKALLCGGPAEDIDSYEDGAAAVENYVRHLTSTAASIPDLLGVAAVKTFLSNEEADWDQPQNKRLRAVLTRDVDGAEVNAKDVVFDWLARELKQRDPHEQRTVVAVMDGESKLRDLQEVKLKRAIGILDIWHVTEYLWELAYCFHRDGSAEAEAFVETYLRKLLEGKVYRVIGGIRQMATKRDLPQPKWDKVEACLTYFAARADYMKYDEYLAAGYPIGSGVVEGACRHLVKDRMEQTGMRWRIAGAQAILSLRAIYVNDDWDAFHADRIQTEQRKLYPYKKCLRAILSCAT